LQQLENKMADLNAEGATLESRLASNPLHHEVAEIGKRLSTVNDEIKALEDRWLSLTAAIEN
jgi:predicted  nucleic acid-binding Zn-ribbon protein